MTRTLRGLNTAYSTNFTASENPLSEGGIWKNGRSDGTFWTDSRSNPQRCFGTEGGAAASIYDDSISHLIGNFTRNQTITGIVFNSAQTGLQSNQEVELHARSTISPGLTKTYEFTYEVTGKYVDLTLWLASFGQFSNFVHISSVPALVSGDQIQLVVSGNILSGYRNGVLLASGSDASLSSGAPGLGTFVHNINDSGDITKYGFTSWSAQSFAERGVSSTRALASTRTIAS